VLGLCRTLVFVEEPATEASVLAALRARRTVTIDRDGRLYGDPAMVAELARDPYQPRTADFTYRGEGKGDRMMRTLGWLGLVGLLVFGRVKRATKRATDEQTST
jgi:hypothetical protein